MTDGTRVTTDEAERTFNLARPVSQRQSPLYALPSLFLANLPGVPLGIARSAIDTLSPRQRACYRLGMTHLTSSCVQAVALMYKAGGGSSLYAAHPLDRHFRDIHTLNQHVIVSQKTYQSAGRMFLGLEPGEPFF